MMHPGWANSFQNARKFLQEELEIGEFVEKVNRLLYLAFSKAIFFYRFSNSVKFS